MPIMDATPNLWFAKIDEPIRIDEMRNGYAADAKNAAKIGCGLKSKNAVSENGRENEYIMPVRASQTGKSETITKNLDKLDSCKNTLVFRKAPMLVSTIPVINTRCGGLSNPSNPKFECHTKSTGPAVKRSMIPMPEILIPFRNFCDLRPFCQLM
jgi:hypothetical protein